MNSQRVRDRSVALTGEHLAQNGQETAITNLWFDQRLVSRNGDTDQSRGFAKVCRYGIKSRLAEIRTFVFGETSRERPDPAPKHPVC